MFEFPPLTGNYAVGTQLYHWIDDKRIEPHNPTDKRELLVQIWYPAHITTPVSTPYAAEIRAEWKEGLLASGFPARSVDEIDTIVTHAQPKVPLLHKDAPYPVVLFSHGYVALRTAYTSYCEELASHGYIVVALGHTYYLQLAKFPNGRVIPAAQDNWEQTKLLDEKLSQQEQELWLSDAQFVLDKLAALNSDQHDIFYQALDLNHIGMFGHSFGGSTAVQLLRRDDRCKAAVDLDGALFGEDAVTPCKKPCMVILGQETLDGFAHHNDKELAKITGFPERLLTIFRTKYLAYIPQLLKFIGDNAHLIMIPGASHGGFSDWAVLKEMPLYQNNKNIVDMSRETGSANGFAMQKMIMAYVVSFFDKYLKNRDVPILAIKKADNQGA